jgi:biotin carboxyl carrier protein
MRYFVSLDPAETNAPIHVDVAELPTGRLNVTLEGKEIPVDVVWLDGSASFIVDGRVVDLTLEGLPPELGAVASGHRSYVRVESERERASALARKGSGGGAEKVVKAPMPGRIVRVLVQAGAAIEAGATLCVIEAMKMENEVKAKAACTVVEVFAAEGTTVENGAKLFALG